MYAPTQQEERRPGRRRANEEAPKKRCVHWYTPFLPPSFPPFGLSEHLHLSHHLLSPPPSPPPDFLAKGSSSSSSSNKPRPPVFTARIAILGSPSEEWGQGLREGLIREGRCEGRREGGRVDDEACKFKQIFTFLEYPSRAQAALLT